MPRLESVTLCRGCRASLRTIWKSTAASTTTYMVLVVTRFLVGVIDGVHDDRQCLQFPVRGGPEDGGPCEVVLVQSACRVRFQLKKCPPWPLGVVPEASAKKTVLWSSVCGRRHGIVGW